MEIKEAISLEKRTITPNLSDVFRAFEECPYDKFSVLLLSLDPYPGTINNKRIADGIAFSSINSKGKPPKSLKFMMDVWGVQYEQTVWKDDTDLTYLANQGVLLLNVYLTTVIGKTGAHKQIWKKFTSRCLELISNENSGLPIVFLGREAKEFAKECNPLITNHYYVSHPASAAYKGQAWDDEKVFVRVNQKLQDQDLNAIQWINKKY